MPHPVLAKIDRAQPYFTRKMAKRVAGENRECDLQLWLPVQLDNSGWVAAVTITDLDLPPISAFPGEDQLDALLNALAFARHVLDRQDGQVLFGDRHRESGGLPMSLDRGFSAKQLAEIETQAIRIADEAAELAHAPLRPSA